MKLFGGLVGLLLVDPVLEEVEDPLGDPGRVDLAVGSLFLSLGCRDVHGVLGNRLQRNVWLLFDNILSCYFFFNSRFRLPST